MPGSCVFFAWGLSAFESLTNLTNSITANSPYDAILTGSGPGYEIAITAKVAGPEFNLLPIEGDGSWNAGGSAYGGGFEFESAGPASVYKVKITGTPRGFGDDYPRVSFDFTLFDVPCPTRIVQPLRDEVFTILANPHGFAIYARSDTHFLKATSLLAMAPAIPSGWTTPYAVFIIGAGRFRNSLTTWDDCTCALDGVPNTWASGAHPRPICLRSAGTLPMLTLAGVPWQQSPLIMYGRNQIDTPTIVGMMWDCIVISDYIPQGSRLMIGGETYEVLSSQNGVASQTRASILWRYTDA